MTIRLAAAQIASSFFDPEKGTAKAVDIIEAAAGQGADLLVFPESFIPGFPIWNALVRPIEAHDLFARFAAASLRVDGPEIARICEAASANKVAVWLGFSERAPYSEGCLWNSAVLIDERGRIVIHHRKLVPTFYEKLSWNRGDGAGLKVCELEIGRVGGLICGENGNPLARYALMAQGEQIHCANYPSVWPFRDPRSAEPYDLGEAIRTRAAAHAFEAKVYVAVSAGVLDQEGLETICQDDQAARDILLSCPSASAMIVAPDGTRLGNVVPSGQEGIVVADVDVAALTALKQHHDMAGYYNRHDVFRVALNTERQRPLFEGNFESASELEEATLVAR